MKSRIFLLTSALLLCGAQVVRAQQASAGAQVEAGGAQAADEETVRVRHRVVFLDALVRDKRTNEPVLDLKEENFEVLADGRARKLSYFTREGDAGRKPLALTVVLDLRRDGAGRFLRRTEIMEAMGAVLSKLPPQDEVAVLALSVGGTGGKREWLARFTRDRAQVKAALALVPSLVAAGSEGGEGEEQPGGVTIADSIEDVADLLEDSKDQPQIKIANKDGSVTSKILAKDGKVITRTVQPDGKETYVEIDNGFDLNTAAEGIAIETAVMRPGSQSAIVWVSDGIAVVPKEDRKETEETLLRTSLTFSAVVVDMKTGIKLLMPIVNPLGNWVGISIYGSTQRLARLTGGESLRVHRPDDYVAALEKIVGNLTGRYSLGFTLAEGEQDDGQMHELEVRARARDAKGKERKLVVTARRGYFMPKEAAPATTVKENTDKEKP